MGNVPDNRCEACEGTGLREYVPKGRPPFRGACNVCGGLKLATVPVRDPDRCYGIEGVVRAFRHRGHVIADVPASFFRRAESVVPRDLTPWGAPDDSLRSHCVGQAESELFTEGEADALIAWLARDPDVTDLRKTSRDTIPLNIMPAGAIPVGGWDFHFWWVSDEADYDLPFQATALVRLYAGRLVDAAVPPRWRPTSDQDCLALLKNPEIRRLLDEL